MTWDAKSQTVGQDRLTAATLYDDLVNLAYVVISYTVFQENQSSGIGTL